MEQVQPWPVVRALGRIVVTPSGAVDAVAATRLRSQIGELNNEDPWLRPQIV